MSITKVIGQFLKNRTWYIFILSVSTFYVLLNRNSIYSFEKLNADNLIFIIWIILLIRPLFSEFEILGVKLKRDVEEVKTEVKEGFSDIRMQMMDLKISNSNANTVNFGDGFLPNEDKIKALISEFVGESNGGNKLDGKETLDIDINLDVEENVIYLFKVRLMIEKRMSDLCEKLGITNRKSINEMVRTLNQVEMINGRLVDLITQVMRIANRGIHGEIVSIDYIEFVKTVIPEIEVKLTEVNDQLKYMICHRCKFNGFSTYENVCPKCGFTTDEY